MQPKNESEPVLGIVGDHVANVISEKLMKNFQFFFQKHVKLGE
jgi:hypothetical protein